MARPPADQPLLTPDLITSVALRLIDRDGAAALSTRKLAAELGVSNKAVYHYYANKEDLLRAVYLGILDRLELPAGRDLPWPEQLRRFARSFRELARRHPSFLVDFLQPGRPAAQELGALDVLYRLIREAGLPDPLVLHTGQLLLNFMIGYLRGEQSGEFGPEVYAASLDLAARHPGQFPTLEALPPPDPDADALFGLAVDLLIGGLEATVAAARAQAPG